MIAYASMLVAPAEEAGIAVPEEMTNKHGEDIDLFKDSHKRFWIFCAMQLGAPMPFPSAHWENAKVIAALKDDELETITPAQLRNRGFAIGYTYM